MPTRWTENPTNGPDQPTAVPRRLRIARICLAATPLILLALLLGSVR